MSLSQVVQTVNANNSQLPHVKARIGTITFGLIDEAGRAHRYDLRGLLIYSEPDCFWMEGRVGESQMIELASGPEHYWVWIKPRKIGWVGRQDGESGGRQMPIDPRQLILLLGVSGIPDNLLAPPFPVLRVDREKRLRIVQFIRPCGGQMVLQRELFVNPDTCLPEQVWLYDAMGQPLLKSELKEWTPISDGGPRFPKIARIDWLGSPGQKDQGLKPGSYMALDFSSVEIYEPNPARFKYREPEDIPMINLNEPRVAEATH